MEVWRGNGDRDGDGERDRDRDREMIGIGIGTVEQCIVYRVSSCHTTMATWCYVYSIIRTGVQDTIR